MKNLLFLIITRFFYLNLIIFITILSIVVFLNYNEILNIGIFKILWNLDSAINVFFIKSNLYNFYLLLFLTSNLILLFWTLKNIRYISMPYALNLLKALKQEDEINMRVSNSFDYFIKKDVLINSFKLIFKNWNSIDLKNYENQKRAICQYLGWDGELDIKQFGQKGVELFFYNFPTYFLFTLAHKKAGSIFLGVGKNGYIYLPINQMTHTICVGESGSGKSNFMHNIIFNLLLNIELVEHFYFVDLKGTEMNIYQQVVEGQLCFTIEDLLTTLIELKSVMTERFNQMRLKNEQITSDKYIFVVIDEIGAVGTHQNKKAKEEIFNLMIEIAQRGRAAKIVLLIFAQKIDSTNIPTNVLTNLQTKVLMKTDSDFNINNTIGTKEDIQKITSLDVADFPRGRYIFKNGITSEKILLQAPVIIYN